MKVICFDLDDTLHKEIDYLKAAYQIIAKQVFDDKWEHYYNQMLIWYDTKDDVFQKVVDLMPNLDKNRLLDMYRYDVHKLTLDEDVSNLLSSLKALDIKLGIITDGRTVTQGNKIKALGLDKYFDEDMIVISESFGSSKPSEENYKYFMDKYPECRDFTYIGDNPQKDFIAPNTLGWNTICLLDDGNNIHKQEFDSLNREYLPKRKITSLKDYYCEAK